MVCIWNNQEQDKLFGDQSFFLKSASAIFSFDKKMQM